MLEGWPSRGKPRRSVSDRSVFGVHQIIEAIAELNSLVGFSRPCRTRIARGDHLGRLAIRIRLVLRF
jgi:hypothetical protein